MNSINFFDRVSWDSTVKNKSDTRQQWVIAMERITERFWCSVSCFGEHYQVTNPLSKGKYAVALITNDDFSAPNPYRWVDRLLCLLILPPLVMLIAKACFRHTQRFSPHTIPGGNNPPSQMAESSINASITPSSVIPTSTSPLETNTPTTSTSPNQPNQTSEIEREMRIKDLPPFKYIIHAPSREKAEEIIGSFSYIPHFDFGYSLSSIIHQTENLEVFSYLITQIQENSWLSNTHRYKEEIFFNLIDLYLEDQSERQITYLNAFLTLYPTLIRSVREGWTAMHYAYLRGDQALIDLLNSRDESLLDIPSTTEHDFDFERPPKGICANPAWTTRCNYRFPANITPAQLRRQFYDIHARDALTYFTLSGCPSTYQKLTYCPWKDTPNDPRVICNYLNPDSMDAIDAQGFTLLHYASLFPEGEPFYQALIEKGANQEIRSVHQPTAESFLFPSIEFGKTAEEFRIAFWKEIAWQAISRRFNQSHSGDFSFSLTQYKRRIQFQDLDSILSKIDVNQPDSEGVRLIHYAVLFDDTQLIEALRKHGAKEDAVPIAIYQERFCTWRNPRESPKLSGMFTPKEFKERFIQLYLLNVLNKRMGLYWTRDKTPFAGSPLGLLWEYLDIPAKSSKELVDSLLDVNVPFPIEGAPECSVLASLICGLMQNFSLDWKLVIPVAEALIDNGANLLEIASTPNNSSHGDLYVLSLYELTKRISASRNHPLLKNLQLKMDNWMAAVAAVDETLDKGEILPPDLSHIVKEYLTGPQKRTVLKTS